MLDTSKAGSEFDNSNIQIPDGPTTKLPNDTHYQKMHRFLGLRLYLHLKHIQKPPHPGSSW